MKKCERCDGTSPRADFVVIPRWQAERILDGLRMTMNVFHSRKKETALDRALCRNYDALESALTGKVQV